MSNYVQTVFFTPKDSLPPSNPAKTIFGAAYDVEFGNIATAISSKYDVASIAAGPIAFALGSAALPSITFVGETGTGLYSNGSGDLGHSTAGVARLTITGSGGTVGSVVIGTATGGAQGAGTLNATGLFVNGTAVSVAGATVTSITGTANQIAASASTGAVTLSFSPNIIIPTPASGTTLVINQVTGQVNTSWTDGTVTTQYYSSGGSTAANFGSTSNTTFNILTNNSSRISITGIGNVTINTPTSGDALTINQVTGAEGIRVTQAAASPGIVVRNTATSFQIEMGTVAAGAYLDASNTGLIFSTQGSANPRLTIGTSGNVTINAPSSGTALAISSVSTSPGITVTGPGTVPITIQELTAPPNNVLNAYIGVATAAFTGGSGINGDLVLVPRTSNTNAILLATGSSGLAAVRVSIAGGGAVVINKPASGTALTIGDSTNAITNATIGVLSIAVGVSFSSNTAEISSSVAMNLGSTASTTTLWANGHNAITLATTGGVTLAAPSSGITLTVNGAASANTINIQAAATGNIGIVGGQGTGSNLIFQRTNVSIADIGSADSIFGGGSATQMALSGRAGITLGLGANAVLALTIATTGGIFTAGVTGGDQGAGTLNATGLFINGAPIAAGIPQNSQSAAYTLVLADANKHIYHPSADTTARTWTIPANASVAFPIGTAVTFDNDTSGGAITLAITTDTLVWLPSGSTGSRTIAANGQGTVLKVTATRWHLTGVGIT